MEVQMLKEQLEAHAAKLEKHDKLLELLCQANGGGVE